MSKQTKIAWCDSTASPWYGCRKVSPGCEHCYIESVIRKMRKPDGTYGFNHGAYRQKSESFERECRKWNRWAGQFAIGDRTRRLRIFPSLCDWLDPEVPIEWLADMLRVIHECPNLDFQLLTKRPELFVSRLEPCLYKHLPQIMLEWLAGNAPPNVWIGTSCENQQYADKRIPELLKIPAKVRFLSLEPMLGPIEITPYIGGWTHRCDCPDSSNTHNGYHRTEYSVIPIGPGNREGGRWICKHCEKETQTKPAANWVIVGGESGQNARPCNVAWIRDIIRQCKAAGVPCFVKQLGSNPVVTKHYPGEPIPDDFRCYSHPKAGDPSEWPEDLRVREIP